MRESCKKRYSKQRETIIEILKNTEAHPTANMIYDIVREELPNISLGTVYRNLSTLVEDGIILKIDTDEAERYDYRINAHSHLICKNCGCVTDIFMEIDNQIDKLAEDASGAKIDSHHLVFCGECKKCISEKLNKI